MANRLKLSLSRAQVVEVRRTSALLITILPPEQAKVWESIGNRCAQAIDFEERKRSKADARTNG